jgi:hypothetical protein
MLPEVAVSPAPRIRATAAVATPPWAPSGNVVAATGVALLEMVAVR